MDHNLDLLKCNVHEPTKVFLNSLIDKGILPTIMHPTRIMQTSASLIDNVFVSSRLHRSLNSRLILSYIRPPTFFSAFKTNQDFKQGSSEKEKRRFVEPWMTASLEQSAKKKQRLYKKILQKNFTKTDVNAYWEYRNTYNRLKRHVQQSYYRKKLAFKTNTKELWKVINKVICKKRHSGSII